ncbi:hypothetical protein O181_073014 [Austropuccinia psidii MF-1]|uniref:Uncharacterized protein n=1 Tax=Austropuccinia psidii MF-1 TaxID=1389203 RepID=A0A9Q3F6A5_9BASI|nr:hypothetical protein [Austropuccinia psidii MF-1]
MKMVHTRNRSNYLVQQDGSGQGRGNNRTSSEGLPQERCIWRMARLPPISSKSAPKTFNINSDPELIQGNVLRVEKIASGSHGNISVPVQKLVQRSQGRGVGNSSKTLEGGHELLFTHQEVSGSREEHRTLRRMVSLVLQGKGKKDKKLVEEQKSFIHRPEERVQNDSRFGERRTSSIKKMQTSSRIAQRTSEET